MLEGKRFYFAFYAISVFLHLLLISVSQWFLFESAFLIKKPSLVIQKPLHLSLIQQPVVYSPPSTDILSDNSLDNFVEPKSFQALVEDKASSQFARKEQKTPKGFKEIENKSKKNVKQVDEKSIARVKKPTLLQRATKKTKKQEFLNKRQNQKALRLRRIYQEKLMNFLAKHKHYPLLAKKLNQEGVVIYYVRVDPRGNFSKVKRVKSTGYKALDDESLKLLLKASGQYPPDRESFLEKRKWLEYKLPIHYRIF